MANDAIETFKLLDENHCKKQHFARKEAAEWVRK